MPHITIHHNAVATDLPFCWDDTVSQMDDWMAGFLTYGLQHARFAFPEHSSSGINNELPAANSCGHSRGIQHRAFTAFPFTPLSGHHRTLKLRGYLKLCKNHPDCGALTVSAQPRIDW